MFQPSKGDVRGFLFDPASMDLEPQCGYCHQPLPVQPRAGSPASHRSFRRW
jgi:hypothetical protein